MFVKTLLIIQIALGLIVCFYAVRILHLFKKQETRYSNTNYSQHKDYSRHILYGCLCLLVIIIFYFLSSVYFQEDWMIWLHKFTNVLRFNFEVKV